mgnify:CR=1 FL=1
MWEQFSAEMESSFETDSLPSSHPIIAENVTELAQLFDSISYSKVCFLMFSSYSGLLKMYKGAVLLRMIDSYLQSMSKGIKSKGC